MPETVKTEPQQVTELDQLGIALEKLKSCRTRLTGNARAEKDLAECEELLGSVLTRLHDNGNTDRNRALLASIVESSNDAIIGWTLDGVITTWNAGAERMYGYSAAEAVGKSIFLLAPPEGLEGMKKIVEKLGRGERLRQFEAVRRTRDGRLIPISLTISPILDKQGRVVSASSIARDISEYKQSIERLRETASNLELANRQLESFNYTVSHDLRTPLNRMILAVQTVEEFCGNRLDAQCKLHLRCIHNTILQMNQLISTLLDFCSLTTIEMRREAVELGAIAQEVACELSATEPERQVTFLIGKPAPVHADRSLLRAVIANLLGNAWKYTGKQDRAVIEFGEMEIAGKPVFFVRDNGPGFDMADAENLFIPFFRLPTARDYKGHGIGLAIVEKIISRHGGRVWAESGPGKGATFCFTLGE